MYRHGEPVLTIQRSPSNTSRNEYSRWDESSRIKIKYGATNFHSSSFTSLGYTFRVSIPYLRAQKRDRFITGSNLVTLRYFGGLTIREAADTLGIAPRTADSWWVYARAWLAEDLSRS